MGLKSVRENRIAVRAESESGNASIRKRRAGVLAAKANNPVAAEPGDADIGAPCVDHPSRWQRASGDERGEEEHEAQAPVHDRSMTRPGPVARDADLNSAAAYCRLSRTCSSASRRTRASGCRAMTSRSTRSARSSGSSSSASSASMRTPGSGSSKIARSMACCARSSSLRVADLRPRRRRSNRAPPAGSARSCRRRPAPGSTDAATVPSRSASVSIASAWTSSRSCSRAMRSSAAIAAASSARSPSVSTASRWMATFGCSHAMRVNASTTPASSMSPSVSTASSCAAGSDACSPSAAAGATRRDRRARRAPRSLRSAHRHLARRDDRARSPAARARRADRQTLRRLRDAPRDPLTRSTSAVSAGMDCGVWTSPMASAASALTLESGSVRATRSRISTERGS